MKKLCVGLMTIVLAFSFTSCSTNETDIEIPQEALLKSYKLQRDASGAYSIDYVVADNTTSNVTKDVSSLTNEINLSRSAQKTKNDLREEFKLDNNKLSVGFVDAETGKKSKFTIEDENITLAKGGDNGEFLKTFGLATNNDGSIQLDFEVNNNIVTEFVYNEELTIYEVHLKKGTTNDKVFSRAIEMPDTGVLRIDFVNHKFLGKGLVETTERKPITTIEDGFY